MCTFIVGENDGYNHYVDGLIFNKFSHIVLWEMQRNQWEEFAYRYWRKKSMLMLVVVGILPMRILCLHVQGKVQWRERCRERAIAPDVMFPNMHLTLAKPQNTQNTVILPVIRYRWKKIFITVSYCLSLQGLVAKTQDTYFRLSSLIQTYSASLH